MPEPLTTTAAILTIMAHSGTVAGRTKLLANKIKSKLKSYVLTDTLETLEALQQNPQLLDTKQQELSDDLDAALQENPDLNQALQQLIDKEAVNDARIGQIIQGNVSNAAQDQSTIVSGNVQGDVNINHHHTQHHKGNGDNIIGGVHNHRDIDIQLNNSSVGGNINNNK